ncbi:MAG: hypothetical protein UR39_C0009G0025 [Candidatus Woesebacteria bacterium GW2011_GWA1_33_30]|uniref:CHAT domain-containing protein n=1 Tax=Candidatus Woesebacteria bacterium GW2011_GWA2_33_28 TaxID=1618561 RepID=A0A0F9ZQV4_9BACT|nr:MAG: hypothetical protein UR38_C0009G0025 [Candidatus Woesebacteria bacterium GW2011_GWA2_33_28]KKP47554.1 MAG: hypothetical protein UR39_C0009G0025 [Candidatus Woesebacteria bacterium GW2011_GWA1_33_30]KKP49166.1 MAG: hypothetical protein UR40_C0010G0025 [Microgenomates group bacterium GW2011_GWC1_33_32]KKP51548.1 MAG: hypothetical protein UR44_C0009G0025 [Candidatus Woesebacteria bacterium GW2011_GWB1_33_38]KKP57732.1 MAG: hypothetical protein UR48_C0011G0020 [Microgenomates group bacteriu
MNHKSLLITRPFYENPTNYLFWWSELLVKLAKEKGFEISDLKNKKVTRKEVEGRLKKMKPSLVVFNGHGDDNSIYGQDDEMLISIGFNDHLLIDKIIFARSCLSAKNLGKACVKLGTTSYIGYDEDFVFIFDIDYVSKPLLDKTARLFLEPSNQVVRSLLKGNLTSYANNSGKEMFLKNITSLLTSETTKEDSSILRYLVWDMKHQVCLGDQNAKI